MNKRTGVVFVLGILLSFSVLSTIRPVTVQAASAKCYFVAVKKVRSAGTCAVKDNGAYGTNDVLKGRDTKGNGMAIPASVNTKAEFITFVINRYNDKGHNHTGAGLIINVMLYGHKPGKAFPSAAVVAKWKALMNTPQVSFSRPAAKYPVLTTSWYDSGKNNVFFDQYSGGARDRNIIRVAYNGDVMADIEVDCGNLTGNGNPPAFWGKMNGETTPQTSGGVTINTGGGDRVAPNQSIRWKHVVWDDGTAGSDTTAVKIAGDVRWTAGSTGPIPTSYKVGTGALPLIYENSGARLTYNKKFAPGAKTSSKALVKYASFKVPSTANTGDTYCQQVYGAPTSVTDATSFASTSKCVIVLKSTNLSCDVVDSLAANPDPYTPLQFTVSAHGPAASTQLELLFKDAGGYTVTQTHTDSGGGDFEYTFTINPPAGGFAIGDFNALVRITGSGQQNWCGSHGSGTPCAIGNAACCVASEPLCCPPANPACNPVIDYVHGSPYIAAYGGDVIAGTSSDPYDNATCNQTDGSDVISWNHDNSPGFSPPNEYAGGGGKAGVFASGNIGHFSSGLNIANLKPEGVSFGNVVDAVDVPGNLYGGSFDGQAPTSCDFSAGASTVLPGSSIGSVNVADNAHTYYTKDSDVYISGNIAYVNSGSGWTQLTDIPSFKLVVTGGNIYIDNNVTRLDGVYVALPVADPVTDVISGGEIFTCATSIGVVPNKTSTSYTSTCNHPLTVNGAFSAKQIHFDRTSGTVGQARASDTFNTAGPAEKFIYSPEMWLPNGSGNSSFDILYYQGLPPVL